MNFRLGDTRIRVSFWFLTAMLFFLMTDRSAMALPLLGAVTIHEGGHLLCLRIQRIPLEDLDFSFTGMRMQTGFLAEDYRQRMALHLAGCFCNLIAAAALALPGSPWLLRFSAVNSAVAIFNLLPLRGLDGGAALEEGFCRIWGAEAGAKAAWGLQTVLCLTAVTGSALFFLSRGMSWQLSLAGAALIGLLLAAGWGERL